MPTNVIMPQMGESIFEGTITKWLKKEGEPLQRDEPLFELSTDKVDTEIPSPVSGVLKKIIVPEGAKVPIQTVVAIVDEGGAAPAEAPSEPASAPAPAAPKPAAPAPVKAEEAVVFSSPLVRRIAEKEGIDLSKVKGTGGKGRITKKDIEAYLEKGKPAPSSAHPGAAVAEAKPAAVAPPAPVLSGKEVEKVPMSPMRARIAEHMIHSRRTSAHVTTFFEVDLGKVADLRRREAADFETVCGTKLTFTPFFATACLRAILDFPILNASVEGNDIVYRRDVNLGIAVALPDGLIVPVVKNAGERSFVELSRSIQDLAERARAKKLSVEEVQGGTFTITNPGIFGGLFATPIINQPQVAILGVGGIEKRPVVIGDAIAIRPMCYLSLTFDHRVIDGAVADQFMAAVKGVLQKWDLPIR